MRRNRHRHDDHNSNTAQKRRHEQAHRGQTNAATRDHGTGKMGTVQRLHDVIGNQTLQQQLAIDQSRDSNEQHAERNASRIIDGSKPASGEYPITGDTDSEVTESKYDGGQPLSDPVRSYFESRMGMDFSDVQIHAGPQADAAARSINATAFTHGTDIVFRSDAYQPDTTEGMRVLAHELTHVGQQQTTTGLGIQRRVDPEDVASEMVGQQFEVVEQFTQHGANLSPGDRVTVTEWKNDSETVKVTGGEASSPFPIPKRYLRPVTPAVEGMAPYSAGVGPQATAVAESTKKLKAHEGKRPEYEKYSNLEGYKAEKTRLESLLKRRQKVLNRKLIQETMFNRFDAVIKREVEQANKAHGLKGDEALDPNLLKSMLFQESQLGTAGAHLEVPPTHPVKTRFNLGQVIDSSGMALVTMLEEEMPSLMQSKLPKIRSNLHAAQRELATLEKKSSLTPAEQTRFTDLKQKSKQNWEVFIWGYTSPDTGASFADVVTKYFEETTPHRNVDYEFWIHMAVFWLFEKKRPDRSWPETIRAYNGSGKAAQHYQQAVVKRAKEAQKAAGAGNQFIPDKI
ncbi:DUF4157 domain-containing protein [Salinigranum sp. GCM10025319]|uniref:eCIS core domain-containing protein n=1 Tax=Salinigranum sp. GCM10025319 TaxID=3252687 RepID=UPI00361E198E